MGRIEPLFLLPFLIRRRRHNTTSRGVVIYREIPQLFSPASRARVKNIQLLFRGVERTLAVMRTKQVRDPSPPIVRIFARSSNTSSAITTPEMRARKNKKNDKGILAFTPCRFCLTSKHRNMFYIARTNYYFYIIILLLGYT